MLLLQLKAGTAKLRVLRTKNVLVCQRALHAYVLTCQRALHTYLLTCQRIFRAYVLTCLAAIKEIFNTK